MLLPGLTSILVFYAAFACGKIDRRSVVSLFNPTRNASNPQTPMQVGNGNFAFGVDVTGLQTFLPFATMSSWGWKNDSLPVGRTTADVESYRGIIIDNHGLQVQYDFGGEKTIETWLIQNPNRLNLARIGLLFLGESGGPSNLTENDLSNVHQVLDLWTGVIKSTFNLNGVPISIKTVSSQSSDSVAITITSQLLADGRLGLFIDFPWNDGKQKFKAPFVGDFTSAANHTTVLSSDHLGARITHQTDAFIYHSLLSGDEAKVTRDSPTSHRYSIHPVRKSNEFSIVVSFAPDPVTLGPLEPEQVHRSSKTVWNKFWQTEGFIDLTGSSDPRARELQRRIILSRYLMRVNEAGDSPPQESGLVNNGWVGAFISV